MNKVTCQNCSGTGRVARETREGLRHPITTFDHRSPEELLKDCPRCNGSGLIPASKLNEDQKIELLNMAIKVWIKRLEAALEAANLNPRNANYMRDVWLIAGRLSKTIAAELGKPEDADVIYDVYKDAIKFGTRARR